jgi:spermidine synthase
MYFDEGKIIASSGDVKVYLYNELMHLEIGPSHNLWMIEDEIKELSKQIGNSPTGNCLEIGLGLGMASQYILSQPEVIHLTTVEINPDVIEVQKQVNKIDNIHHTILCGNGLDFMLQTEEQYEFIFFDHYALIDEDTLEMLNVYNLVANDILTPKGIIKAWYDVNTVEEDAEVFFDIFKGMQKDEIE